MMAELLLEFSPSGYLTDTQPVPLYVDTPTAQVTRPTVAVQPGLESPEEELKTRFAGRGSVSVTLVAGAGPKLVTVTL
jgi:hypothetical protein